jgi:hypothetical protein
MNILESTFHRPENDFKFRIPPDDIRMLLTTLGKEGPTADEFIDKISTNCHLYKLECELGIPQCTPSAIRKELIRVRAVADRLHRMIEVLINSEVENELLKSQSAEHRKFAITRTCKRDLEHLIMELDTATKRPLCPGRPTPQRELRLVHGVVDAYFRTFGEYPICGRCSRDLKFSNFISHLIGVLDGRESTSEADRYRIIDRAIEDVRRWYSRFPSKPLK